MNYKMLLTFSLFSILLVGCSEEIVEEDTTNITERQQLENNDSEVSGVEGTKVLNEEKTSNNSEVVEIIDSESSSQEDSNPKEESEIESNNVISDFYAYYNEHIISSDSQGDLIAEEEPLVARKLNDTIIELPTIESNEQIQNEVFEQVALEQLINTNIVTLLAEPVSKGVLLNVNLNLLYEQFPAESYSFSYSDQEYSIIVSKEDSKKGLVLIRAVEGLEEEITSSGFMNIIN